MASLTNCYEAEFEAFVVNNDDGVPLEHLGKLIMSHHMYI